MGLSLVASLDLAVTVVPAAPKYIDVYLQYFGISRWISKAVIFFTSVILIM